MNNLNEQDYLYIIEALKVDRETISEVLHRQDKFNKIVIDIIDDRIKQVDLIIEKIEDILNSF